jgi:Ala-tRNA(Pro) deacylase
MLMPFDLYQLLEEKRIPYAVIHHPPTYDAQHEAAAAHVPGRHVAKTVVCFADDEPIQAIVPAPCTVDVEELRKLAGARVLRVAEARELPPLYPGCDRGMAPPIRPLFHQRVFLDESLAADPRIVVNAGTYSDAVRLNAADFLELTGPTVGAFAKWPGE